MMVLCFVFVMVVGMLTMADQLLSHLVFMYLCICDGCVFVLYFAGVMVGACGNVDNGRSAFITSSQRSSHPQITDNCNVARKHKP